MKGRYLLILLLLCACGKAVPGDVLPQKKMQAAMWDIMRADELVSYYQEHDSLKNVAQHRADSYAQVFRIQGITQDEFKHSLRFYEEHPDLFKPVLDSLQGMAERAQAKGDTARKGFPPPPVDSSRRTVPRNPDGTALDTAKVRARRLQKSLHRPHGLPVM